MPSNLRDWHLDICQARNPHNHSKKWKLKCSSMDVGRWMSGCEDDSHKSVRLKYDLFLKIYT